MRLQGASPIVVGVRSSLTTPVPAEAQGRIYTIQTIQQISSTQKLAPPVEVNVLLSRVRQSLEAEGFMAAKAGQQPEIVLTVEYGRDWLRNPYLADNGIPPPLSGLSSVTPAIAAGQGFQILPKRTIAGLAVPSDTAIGAESRTQKAGYEKLYLRLTAWQYHSDPKERKKQLWCTTMVWDDPYADLNALAADLLAAGSPYFGRDIKEPELEVSQPLPESRVNVGAPQVMDDSGAKPGHKFPMQVNVHFGPEESTKSFNLPAGEAVTTLREFARQADTEIIYSSAQINGIKTPRINGELSPRAALDRLLEGSGLIAVLDEKSGAFVIRGNPNPGH